MMEREDLGELREDTVVFVLPARPPFRLDLTAWTLRRRPDNRIDRWDGRVYRRVLLVGQDRTPVDVEVQQSEALSGSPELQVTVSKLPGRLDVEHDVTAQLTRALGLNLDLQGFYQLAERDPILVRLVAPFRGVKPPRFPTVFEALVNAIACQQLSLTLGILLLNRLTAAFGRPGAGPGIGAGETGARAFPAPEDLAEVSPEELRPFGFSRQKSRYLIDLARAVADGTLDLEALADLGDEDALARLKELRGIGRWSAEYVLLRGLGRLDVFPGDDVGARNRLQRRLGLEDKLDYDGVQRTVQRWRPYRGLIYFFMLLDGLAAAGAIEGIEIDEGSGPETK